MTKRIRRNFTPEQKVAILKQHLIDHKPVSDVCELHDLHPNQFYMWQRLFFENGAAAFAKPTNGKSRNPAEVKLKKLEEQLARKDGVIAEITQEYVQLKKELGEL